MSRKEDALEYHSRGRKGKLEVVPTKPLVSQIDLSLAYTPGVAEPCLEIAKDEDKSWEYTARGNLVAVISNGTAVLGLGDIGPAAGKPVMEGKACLFKKFADIDVFDLEIAEKDVDKFCRHRRRARADVRRHQPRGHLRAGVLRDRGEAAQAHAHPGVPRRPARHRDHLGRRPAQRRAARRQAARRHQARRVGRRRRRDRVRRVLLSASACARENVMLVDSQGRHPHRAAPTSTARRRSSRSPTTAAARSPTRWTAPTCSWACRSPDTVTPEMLKTMAERPIIFALANPDPEIAYPDAIAARPDALVATGRSDFPNQVNNVLGFPYIFRGALDCRATHDLRGDEARRRPRARRADARAGARQRDHGVRRQVAEDGPRLLHPQAVRSARAVVGRAGGRRGRDGVGRRAHQVRHRRVPRAPDVEGLATPRTRSCARSASEARREPQAHRVPARRRTRACCARCSRSSTRASPSRSCSAAPTRSRRCATRCRSTCCSHGVEIIDPRTERATRATPSGCTSCASARA